jgi:Na+-driven multidrug efflux pump
MNKMFLMFLMMFLTCVNAVSADLATDMGTITTSASDGVGLVGVAVATVIGSVFSLILLLVGSRWLFDSVKFR